MSCADGKPIHCLSFDVEEHFQVSAFWSESRRRKWDHYESRVESNTRKVANTLAAHGTKATFFVLGWVAERYPGLIKDLADQGHEIASHGYGHELVTTQTPEEFRQDVRKAKDILENLTGIPINGYRAPSFSITAKTSWALQILVEEGYLYDSSMYDRFHRSKNNGRIEGSSEIKTTAGTIWEIPLSTVNVLGFQIPVAGGGYFRLFPYAASKAFLKKLERRGTTVVMYLHPWEIDPEQPRMDGPWLSRVRHYINLHKTENRLICLLQDFRFAPIREVIGPIAQMCRERGGSLLADSSLDEVQEPKLISASIDR